MALPNSITNSTPVGSDLPSTIDNQIRDLKLAVQDILGIPNATAISAAGLNFVAGGLDRVIFQDAAGDPTAAGRLQRNATLLKFHDGTAARTLYQQSGTDVAVGDGGTGISSGTSGGVLGFTGATTLASSAALTANGVVLGGGAGATPTSTAAMTNGQVLVGSTGVAPVPATLTAGATMTVTNGAGSITVAGTVLRSYLAGYIMSTAGSSTTMTIGAGLAADSTNARYVTDASSIGKTTAAWVVGTGNGGLDTGVIANSTWYHFYTILRSDTGVVDRLFSLSASAPTMPANYDFRRRVGAGMTDGSGNWTAFVQDGRYFQWLVPINDWTTASSGAVAVLRTVSVPTSIKVIWVGFAGARTSVGNGAEYTVLITDPATTDTAPSSTLGMTAAQGWVGGTAIAVPSQMMVQTNTSAQVRTRVLTDSSFFGGTIGWWDDAGKDS